MLSKKFVAFFLGEMSLSQLVSGFVRPTAFFMVFVQLSFWKKPAGPAQKFSTSHFPKLTFQNLDLSPPKKKEGWGVVCQTKWMDPFDNNLVKIHMCAIMAGPP